jgi:hypothetical protein
VADLAGTPYYLGSCLSGCFRRPLAVVVSPQMVAHSNQMRRVSPRISSAYGRTKAEEGLKSRGWRLSPIVAKDEFIQINLELITTDAVMGSE